MHIFGERIKARNASVESADKESRSIDVTQMLINKMAKNFSGCRGHLYRTVCKLYYIYIYTHA